MSNNHLILSDDDKASLIKYRVLAVVSLGLSTLCLVIYMICAWYVSYQPPKKELKLDLADIGVQIPRDLVRRFEGVLKNDPNQLWIAASPRAISSYQKIATPLELKFIDAQLRLVKHDTNGAKAILKDFDLPAMYRDENFLVDPKLAYIFETQLYGGPQSTYVTDYIDKIDSDWKKSTAEFKAGQLDTSQGGERIKLTMLLLGFGFAAFGLFVKRRLKKFDEHLVIRGDENEY